MNDPDWKKLFDDDKTGINNIEFGSRIAKLPFKFPVEALVTIYYLLILYTSGDLRMPYIITVYNQLYTYADMLLFICFVHAPYKTFIFELVYIYIHICMHIDAIGGMLPPRMHSSGGHGEETERE